jgi:cytosine/uracil/thiamine/allantoin permease
LNLWSIFDDAPSGDYHYTRGFNWLALGSLIFGQAVYIYLYNPITGEVDERFVFAPASLFAFVSAGIVYWVGMRLLAIYRKAGADSAIIAERSTGRHLITPNI